MPVTYYLDGTNLGNSTSVYLDANLTQPAPDGFYADSVTYRQLSGGVLLPAVLCPNCDGTPVACVEYTVSNRSTVDNVSVRYRDCNGVSQVITITPDSEQTFCAQQDSLDIIGNADVVLNGDCPTP